jgi:hypothetical protein
LVTALATICQSAIATPTHRITQYSLAFVEPLPIFETLVFSLQPPSNKFGANSKSPLKSTENNSLVTINPPCLTPLKKQGGLVVANIKSSSPLKWTFARAVED